jgi:hypothetical protein
VTCQSALEVMLDAEPFELDAGSLTPLGQHLRECKRCHSVAAQLAQDTRLLANALKAPAVQRPVWRAIPTLMPALALGAIVIAVMLPSGGERAPTRTPAVAPPAVGVPPSSSPSPNVSNGPATVTRTRHASPRAFARAVAVAPVRLETLSIEASSWTVESNAVTVSPPPGTRATVMHTSNPKFVVVWLH